MPRKQTATLPLHQGSAPSWLFERMEKLGGAIAELIIGEYGRDEFIRRLADPYWFQAFGCVLGFDWHSSGVTTTTMGALKAALDPEEHGLVVAGGKGRTSRKTPDEIDASPLSLPAGKRAELRTTSRMSAMVDNACVQDSYTLYHHTMVISEDGDWCVVQQGMNDSTARRYHWRSDEVDEYVVEPHHAICSQADQPTVMDLTASRSEPTRAISVDLVNDNPDHLKQFTRSSDQRSLAAYGGGGPSLTDLPPVDDHPSDLTMPSKHELRRADLSAAAIDQLQTAYEVQPDSYSELVALDGIGPKSLRALALIADLVYNAETSTEDPAMYAYAHGGKDGTPQPVDRERYDRSIDEIRAALGQAEVDRDTRQTALKRLAELQA